MTWVVRLHHYSVSDDPRIFDYDEYDNAESFITFYANQNNLKAERVPLLPFRWTLFNRRDNKHVGWAEIDKKENYVINRIREWLEAKSYHCPHDDIVINYDLFMELLDELESEQE